MFARMTKRTVSVPPSAVTKHPKTGWLQQEEGIVLGIRSPECGGQGSAWLVLEAVGETLLPPPTWLLVVCSACGSITPLLN